MPSPQHLRLQRRHQHLNERKAKAYRWLYEFTRTQCTACVDSGCACKDSICAHVEREAEKRGVQFAHTGHPLRFIGEKGCIVPPHLRETCTIYLCAPAQVEQGFPARRYGRLKRLCERLDWRLMEIEDELKREGGSCI